MEKTKNNIVILVYVKPRQIIELRGLRQKCEDDFNITLPLTEFIMDLIDLFLIKIDNDGNGSYLMGKDYL